MPDKKMIVGVALMALLVLPGVAVLTVQAGQMGSIQVKNADEASLPEMAKISLNEAVKAALQAVPGKALRAELENEDGYLVYGVEVASADRQVTDVKVDAGNGKILKTERDQGNQEEHETEHAKNGHEQEE